MIAGLGNHATQQQASPMHQNPRVLGFARSAWELLRSEPTAAFSCPEVWGGDAESVRRGPASGGKAQENGDATSGQTSVRTPSLATRPLRA